MAVTIDLGGDSQARLESEARRRGVSIDEVVADLAALLPPPTAVGGRRLGFVGLGASTSDRGARDADTLLAEGFGRD